MKDESSRPSVPASTWLLVAAVVGGALWIQRPYESLRPGKEGELVVEESVGEAPVVARLWQDPFSPVEQYDEDVQKDGEEVEGAARHFSLSFLHEAISKRLAESGKPAMDSESLGRDDGTNRGPVPTQVAILSVLVPGSHWPVDVEARIRERHAVVSALGRMGYVPDWDRRIGFLDTRWLNAANPFDVELETIELLSEGAESSLYGSKALPLSIPYEWFRLPSTTGAGVERPRSVLVLWINESFFGKHVLNGLDQLLCRVLDGDVPLVRGLKSGSITLELLGPTSSTTLLSITEWLRRKSQAGGRAQDPEEHPRGGRSELLEPAPGPQEHREHALRLADRIRSSYQPRDFAFSGRHELARRLERAFAIGGEASGSSAVVEALRRFFGRTRPEVIDPLLTQLEARDLPMPRTEADVVRELMGAALRDLLSSGADQLPPAFRENWGRLTSFAEELIHDEEIDTGGEGVWLADLVSQALGENAGAPVGRAVEFLATASFEPAVTAESLTDDLLEGFDAPLLAASGSSAGQSLEEPRVAKLYGEALENHIADLTFIDLAGRLSRRGEVELGVSLTPAEQDALATSDTLPEVTTRAAYLRRIVEGTDLLRSIDDAVFGPGSTQSTRPIVERWRSELFAELAGQETWDAGRNLRPLLEGVLQRPDVRASLLALRSGFSPTLADPPPSSAQMIELAETLHTRLVAYLDPENKGSAGGKSAVVRRVLDELVPPNAEPPEGGMARFIKRLLGSTDKFRNALVEATGSLEDSDPYWTGSVVRQWQLVVLTDVAEEVVRDIGLFPLNDTTHSKLLHDVYQACAEYLQVLEQGERDRWSHYALSYVMDRIQSDLRRPITFTELTSRMVPQVEAELLLLSSRKASNVPNGEAVLQHVGALVTLEVAVRILRRPQADGREHWRTLVAQLPDYLSADPRNGILSDELDKLAPGLLRRWSRPPDGDARAFVRWLMQTAGERRKQFLSVADTLALERPPGATLPLGAQLRFELSRWERDLAELTSPNDPVSSAMRLHFKLEQHLPQGIPRDVDLTQLLTQLATVIEGGFLYGDRFPLYGASHETLASRLLRAVVACFGDDRALLADTADVAAAILEWREPTSNSASQVRRGGAGRVQGGGPAFESGRSDMVMNKGSNATPDDLRDVFTRGRVQPEIEAYLEEHGRLRSSLPYLRILNSHATAPASSLGLGATTAYRVEARAEAAEVPVIDALLEQVAPSARPHGVRRFVPTVRTDDRLLRATFRELGERGFEPDGHHRIVLISELDTHYGRALEVGVRLAFERTFGGDSGEDGRPRRSREVFHSFNYIRGLDGEAPKEESEGVRRAPTSPSRELLASPETPEFERPEGASQFDYVRRLTQTLLRLDEELGEEGARVFAVGVLGSDVFDKALILQALRPSFPGAVFFTTDLDASLVHPGRGDWNRNLLVASTYGFELSPELQGGVPPFRGSYQTATFVACQLALGGLEADPSGDKALPMGIEDVVDDLRVRLFEIGRRGAVDVTGDDSPPPLYPAGAARRPGSRSMVLAGAALMLLACLLFPFSRRLQALAFGDRWLDGYERRALQLLILMLAGGATLWAVAVWSDDAEPFGMWDGISVWPSLLMRMLAIALGAYFVYSSLARLDRDAAGVGKTLGVSRRARGGAFAWRIRIPQDPEKSLLRVLLDLRDAHGIATWRAGKEHDGGGVVRATQLWSEYRERSRLGSRLVRLAPIVAASLAFFAVIVVLGPDRMAPARGAIARGLEGTTYVLVGLALFATTLLVIDASLLFKRFVRLLAPRQSSWGAPAMRAPLIAGRGLAPEAASDFLDVEVVARHSVVVGRLVLLPFVLVLVVILAQLPFFDRWAWPPADLFVLVLILLGALIPAFLLRRTAEFTRGEALRRLRRKVAAANDGVERERLQLLCREIERDDRGAFSPYMRSPVVQALLLPFGGVGLYALLEFLMIFEL